MRFRFPGLNGCLLLLTLATAGAGQSQPGPDSLVQELKSHSKKDTLYLETLITLARKTRTQDFSKSESYFSEAISLSRSLKRSEEHTSELQSRENLVCRLLLEKKKERR